MIMLITIGTMIYWYIGILVHWILVFLILAHWYICTLDIDILDILDIDTLIY